LDENESQVLLKQKHSVNYNSHFIIFELNFSLKNKLTVIAENSYQHGTFLPQD